MKMPIIKSLFYACCCVLAIQITSCKKNEAPAPLPMPDKNAPAPTPADEPVTISPDTELNDNATDAVKDFPTVTATVTDGVITLDGSVSRDRLPVLMESVHRLHPKKVVNNLTINK